MQIRNPIYTADGRIDCEIEHPAYGWIPFTAAADDPEPHGREIHAVALAMGPAAYVAPPPRAPRVPDLVSKLALVKAMREVGMDGQPAIGASIWDAVKAAIAAAGGDMAEDWQLANYIPRHDPMINALAAQLVLTDPPREAMLDALFLRAAQLE